MKNSAHQCLLPKDHDELENQRYAEGDTHDIWRWGTNQFCVHTAPIAAAKLKDAATIRPPRLMTGEVSNHSD
jgi:hypothetical protein